MSHIFKLFFHNAEYKYRSVVSRRLSTGGVMKFLARLFSFIVVGVLSFMYLQCGGNPSEEAENAFQNENYNLAIQLFSEAAKAEPDNPTYKERIAVSYMHRGKEYFDKTKNIKSFTGNFEKATEYIPENPSPEFKKYYSEMLYVLAESYMASNPENDIQREDFLNSAITNLEEALYMDETNKPAEDLLAKIKADNFQKMLDKGKDFYEKATKQKNYDLYFSAEYYFKKASDFDIYNQEVKKLLSQTRKQTLSVLNYRHDLAIAIIETKHQGDSFILDLRIKNFLPEPVEINVDNFKIYDTEGKTYNLDKALMDGKLSKASIKNTTLDTQKSFVDGIVVIALPNGVNPEYLSYNDGKKPETRKYFP